MEFKVGDTVEVDGDEKGRIMSIEFRGNLDYDTHYVLLFGHTHRFAFNPSRLTLIDHDERQPPELNPIDKPPEENTGIGTMEWVFVYMKNDIAPIVMGYDHTSGFEGWYRQNPLNELSDAENVPVYEVSNCLGWLPIPKYRLPT